MPGPRSRIPRVGTLDLLYVRKRARQGLTRTVYYEEIVPEAEDPILRIIEPTDPVLKALGKPERLRVTIEAVGDEQPPLDHLGERAVETFCFVRARADEGGSAYYQEVMGVNETDEGLSVAKVSRLRNGFFLEPDALGGLPGWIRVTFEGVEL